MSYGFDKSKLSDLEKKKVKILKYQLAFENYEDNTSIKLEEFSKINTDIVQLRNGKLNIEEANELSDKILAEFNLLYLRLTKEEQDRFIFDEDGSISYKWNMDIIKNGKVK